ncbi:hypothetical protein Ancab_025255 [Ancistrocladus abbreviatus]
MTQGKVLALSSVSKLNSKNPLSGISSRKKVDSLNETSQSHNNGDNRNSHELTRKFLKWCNDERSSAGLPLPSQDGCNSPLESPVGGMLNDKKNSSSKAMSCDHGLGVQSPIYKEDSVDGIRSKVVMGLSIGPEVESLYTRSKGHRKIKALWTFYSSKIGWTKGDGKRKKKCSAVGRKGSAQIRSKRKATDAKFQAGSQNTALESARVTSRSIGVTNI